MGLVFPMNWVYTTKGALENQETKPIPTVDILKIIEFMIMNNYFEFNKKVKQQLSGTASTLCK